MNPLRRFSSPKNDKSRITAGEFSPVVILLFKMFQAPAGQTRFMQEAVSRLLQVPFKHLILRPSRIRIVHLPGRYEGKACGPIQGFRLAVCAQNIQTDSFLFFFSCLLHHMAHELPADAPVLHFRADRQCMGYQDISGVQFSGPGESFISFIRSAVQNDCAKDMPLLPETVELPFLQAFPQEIITGVDSLFPADPVIHRCHVINELPVKIPDLPERFYRLHLPYHGYCSFPPVRNIILG